MSERLLAFDHVSKSYLLDDRLFAKLTGKGKRLRAVDDVSFDIQRGEIVGLVGESGSGKSTLSQIAVRLVEPTEGAVYYRGRNVAELKGSELAQFRASAQMVFQDSHSSLNPRKTIDRALLEALTLKAVSPAQRSGRCDELLTMVGLDPSLRKRYPHELSGGQRQRIGIARALAMEPELLVADEPVSSLDVSLQAQIVNLLLELKRELDLTILFVSHDLALVNYISDRTAVMQGGQLVEIASTGEIMTNPKRDYTKRLLAAVPRGIV